MEKENERQQYTPTEGKIQFCNVSFSYNDKAQLLDGLSFTLASGTINYLTYKGKTTILKLLVGLHEPSQGTILLDGVDQKNFSLQSIRKHIAFCSDHTMLQGNTLFKCLFLTKENYNRDEVQACLHLLHFSMTDKDGDFDLHQDIGRDAKLLSQSDYQKLKIARTFLSKKKILLFDNMIEHLEPEVQRAIIAYLEKIKNERTIVVSKRSIGSLDNKVRFYENGLVNKWN